jgi:hypothetical protein
MNPAASEITKLIKAIADAHAKISREPAAALNYALQAGDNLIALKDRLPHGAWGDTLQRIGIAPRTAALYMQLARNRELIVAAGCTSIRQAQALLADRKPPRARRRRSVYETGPEPQGDDRYEEGYRAGYAKGKQDGYAQAAHGRSRRATNGNGPVAPQPADLKWILKRVHPDVAGEKDSLKATRVAQWLTELLETARTAS